MEAQDSSNFTCHVGDGRISFGNGQQPFSFTWNPPSAPVADDVAEGNGRKRRRVQVDVDNQGIAVLKLGAEMTFDFKSTHADAEKKLVDVTAERDQLKANVETLEMELVQRNQAIQTQKDEEFVIATERDELKNGLKKMAAKLKDSQSKFNDSQAKLKDSQNQLEDLEDDLDDAKEEKSTAETQRERAKIQLKNIERKIREFKDEIKTNKATAAAARDAASKQLQQLEQEKKKVQNEMIQLRASKDEQLSRLQNNIQLIEGEKVVMKTEMNNVKTERDEYIRLGLTATQKGNALQQQLHISQKEQARLSDALQRLESASNCCEGCKRLEKELKEALAIEAKTRAELRKLQQAAKT